MKKSLEKQEEEFLHSIKKKKRKMKINTELNCWRECSRKYPSNEKKKTKTKIRKEKKKKMPDLFSGILQGIFFFFTRSARQSFFFALLF